MRASVRFVPFVLAAFLAPQLVLAQGLGDVAARERQKRETAGPRPKARVLSNDDLKKDEAGKTASSEAAASAPETTPDSSQAAREQPDAPESEERARLEQAQAEVDSAREGVVAAEQRVKELGDKLNPMSPSFIYGASQAADAAGEEIRTRQALREAEAQLAQARDSLVRANQAQERVRQGQPARPPEDR